MERSRLNLRVIDKGRPGNIFHQHSESGMAKCSKEILVEISLDLITTYIFSQTPPLAAEGVERLVNFTKARITEDLASAFGVEDCLS